MAQFLGQLLAKLHAQNISIFQSLSRRLQNLKRVEIRLAYCKCTVKRIYIPKNLLLQRYSSFLKVSTYYYLNCMHNNRNTSISAYTLVQSLKKVANFHTFCKCIMEGPFVHQTLFSCFGPISAKDIELISSFPKIFFSGFHCD